VYSRDLTKEEIVEQTDLVKENDAKWLTAYTRAWHDTSEDSLIRDIWRIGASKEGIGGPCSVTLFSSYSLSFQEVLSNFSFF
jgi:hypothetical protein